MPCKLVNAMQPEVLEIVFLLCRSPEWLSLPHQPQQSCLLVDLLIRERNAVGSPEGSQRIAGTSFPPLRPIPAPPSLPLYSSSGTGLDPSYLDMNETPSFKMLIVQPGEREPVIRPSDHHETGA